MENSCFRKFRRDRLGHQRRTQGRRGDSGDGMTKGNNTYHLYVVKPLFALIYQVFFPCYNTIFFVDRCVLGLRRIDFLGSE